MSDLIELLERLGQDARLRHAAPADFERHLRDLGFDLAERTALIARDGRSLESLLGIDGEVCCLIYMPRDIPDEEETPSRVDQPVPEEKEWVPA